jgi:hypothetical protein
MGEDGPHCSHSATYAPTSRVLAIAGFRHRDYFRIDFFNGIRAEVSSTT